MRLIQIREFANKNHKILLFMSVFLIIALDSFVISQRPLHLTNDSSWWLIIQNVESRGEYKACDPSYIPNCNMTDQVTAMREPIPVFLFAFLGRVTQNSHFAFQFSQLVLNLLVCLLIYLLTQEIESRTLGLIAAFGWAFYLYGAHTVMNVNGDLIAGVFVILGVFFLSRALKSGRMRDWLLCGLFFGLAVLSRSSTLVIFLTLLGGSGLYSWRSGKWRSTWYRPMFSVILFGLVMLPWVIRNEIVFGKPVLGTTLVGYNLYRHNAILASGESFHYVGASEAYREVQTLYDRTPELHLPINEAGVDAIFRSEALRIIREYPARYIGLSVYRLIPLLFNIGVPDQYGEKMTFIDNLIVIQQVVLMAMFILALWKGDWYMRLLAMSILLFMSAYLAVDSQLRYMIPVMPLIIVLGVVGVDRYFRSLSGNRWPCLPEVKKSVTQADNSQLP